MRCARCAEVPIAGFIGRTATIFQPSEKRFVNVRANGIVGRSEVSQDGSLNGWSWEHFQAVDAGNRQIAFWNLHWRRFLRMDDKPGMSAAEERPDGTLKVDWNWERFRVVDVGDGLVGLWSPSHKRFVRLCCGNDPDTSEPRADATMPSSWVWERLKIALLPGAPSPLRELA